MIFDVNRAAEIETFMNVSYDNNLHEFLGNKQLNYQLAFVTNAQSESGAVLERLRLPGSSTWQDRETGLFWPKGMYSLSHVAIPFPECDPVYGAGEKETYTLGTLEARGEKGVLRVPLTLLMRLRYNPFFGYIEQDLESSLNKLFETQQSEKRGN